MGGGLAPTKETKTVVVLGCAYGGTKAVQVLAEGLPNDWKLIVIDRNSHANHVYVMPRFAVLPGHEFKCFIPYTNVFLEGEDKRPNHIMIKTQILSIRPNSVTIADSFPELGIPTREIAFDYALYALGANLPAPMDLWGQDPRESIAGVSQAPEQRKEWTYNGFKTDGTAWLRERQKVIKAAPTVLVVGGGALGIQFATDIKAVHPEKKVTLLHSRKQLLPRFDMEMHEEIRKAMDLQEIELVLGERLDLSTLDKGTSSGTTTNARGQRVVRTESGREIAADLVLLCTGQKPNTSMLKAMDPATINPNNGLAYVARTMQLTTAPSVDGLAVELEQSASLSEKSSRSTSEKVKDPFTYRQIFAVGDAADAFGAIAAGHTAYYQGWTAAKNILKLVENSSEKLEEYAPGDPAIKVSLGLTKSVYQVGNQVDVKDDGVPDLHAPLMWPVYGMKVEKDEDMYP